MENNVNRLYTGDVLSNVDIIENLIIEDTIVNINTILFPNVIIMNQDCDLQQDYDTRVKLGNNCLLHLLMVPLFDFQKFLSGEQWGDIINSVSNRGTIKDTKIKLIKQNEIPRYHYINYGGLPESIVDFKHFFTINRDEVYDKYLKNRIHKMPVLYREKLLQRFSFYISRIGLPDEISE